MLLRRLYRAWSVLIATHYVVITERVIDGACCAQDNHRQVMIEAVEDSLLRLKYNRGNDEQ